MQHLLSCERREGEVLCALESKQPSKAASGVDVIKIKNNYGRKKEITDDPSITCSPFSFSV
jgi:hypothetical protein